MATKLTAQIRTEIGTGASRRLRHDGKIPAILYGEGGSTPITLDSKTFRAATTHGGGLLTLSIDGQEAITTLIKEIQRDAIKDTIDHVDLQKVALTEEIHSTVPIRLLGEAPGTKLGGVLQHSLREIEVRAQAQNLPEALEVDISGLEFGQAIHVFDLTLPPGVEVLKEADSIVVAVVAPQVQVEEEVEAPEEEGEAEVAGEEAAAEAAES